MKRVPVGVIVGVSILLAVGNVHAVGWTPRYQQYEAYLLETAYFQEDGVWYAIYRNTTFQVQRGVLFVRFREEDTPEAVAAALTNVRFPIIGPPRHLVARYFALSYAEDEDPLAAAAKLKSMGLFAFVECPTLPCQPYGLGRLEIDDFSEASDTTDGWHIRNTYANWAWGITTGDSTVRVVVFGGHVDADHVYDTENGDLLDNYCDACDYDFADGDDDATGSDGSHETEVIGIIGAVTNNGRHAAGIGGGNHQAGKRGLKVAGFRINLTPENQITAVQAAADSGVRVSSVRRTAPRLDLPSGPARTPRRHPPR